MVGGSHGNPLGDACEAHTAVRIASTQVAWSADFQPVQTPTTKTRSNTLTPLPRPLDPPHKGRGDCNSADLRCKCFKSIEQQDVWYAGGDCSLRTLSTVS